MGHHRTSALKAGLVCLLLPSGASANEAELCSSVANLARVIMALRQVEAPLSKMMELAEEEVVRRIVLAAYERPAYSALENQERATNKFANDIEHACYTSGWGRE